MASDVTIDLSPRRIVDDVMATTGLSDFGDSRFVEDFTAAIDGVTTQVKLNTTGQAVIAEFAHRLLTNRLRLEDDLKRHPEIHDEVLAPPIVITGFPRTGTTKLQRMIAADPNMQSLYLWRLLNPAPFPDHATGGTDPRIDFALEVEQQLQAFPAAWAAHPTPALEVEEDLHLHELTMLAPTFPMRSGALDLLADLTPVPEEMYAYTRTALKYLQWQDPQARGQQRPWVLKSPVHIGNPTLLLKIFPNAVLVHCHRDVEVSMASTARLIEAAREIYSDDVDPLALGQEVVAHWSSEWERNIAQRKGLGLGFESDVRFEDIRSNALAVIEQIYARAGLDITDEGRAAMLRWEADNQEYRHGKHVYNADPYGFTPESIRGAFDGYLSHFADAGIYTSGASRP